MLKTIIDSHKIKKLVLILLPIIILTFILVTPAIATNYGLEDTAKKAYGQNVTGVTIPEYLGRLSGAALALSGSIFLFLIVWGGIWIMTAAGNTDKLNKGKTIIIWAIIGVLVLGSAYAITSFVFTAIQGGDTPAPPTTPPT